MSRQLTDRSWHGGRLRTPLAACAPLLLSVACGPGAPIADWVLPEIGTAEVFEYGFATEDQRADQRIELRVDLVIGDSAQADHEIFKTNALAVNDQYDVFVKDISPKRVLVFDRNGDLKRIIGKEGEGPGELASPSVLLIVDNTLTVPDIARGRFLRWSFGGDLLAEVPASLTELTSVLALRNGAVLATTVVQDGGARATGFRRVSLVEEQPYEFPALATTNVMATINGRSRTVFVDEAPRPTVATDRRSGTVYLGHGEAYEVAAYRQDGTPAWGIKIAAPRYPITRAAKRAAVDRFGQMGAMFGGTAAPSVGDLAWPEFAGAIRALRVDGRGRLYVFPRVAGTSDSDAPVDVYGTDGALLFSGTMPFFHWGDVVDDFIYTWDPVEYESTQTVVRYELVAPFIDGDSSPASS